MKKYIIAISLSAAYLIFSCGIDLTSDTRYEGDLYFVTGYLVEGKPVSSEYPIRIGKTASVADTVDLSSMFIMPEVKIIDMENRKEYPLEPVPFEEQKFFGYYDPDAALIPEQGKTYKLEVRIDDLLIWAQTRVPNHLSFKVNEAFSEDTTNGFPEAKYDKLNTDNPLEIKAPVLSGENDIRLYLSAYCLEERENAFFNESFPILGGDTLETDEEYEDPVNGEPRKIYYTYYHVPDSNDIIVNKAYNIMFLFYGRYEFQIRSLDSNYFNYLYNSDEFIDGEGFHRGGINNGVGFFGSISGVKLYTRILRE